MRALVLLDHLVVEVLDAQSDLEVLQHPRQSFLILEDNPRVGIQLIWQVLQQISQVVPLVNQFYSTLE